MKRFYCTYFDKAYLVRALALIDSVNRNEKNDFVIFCVCMDEISRILLEEIAPKHVVIIPFHDIEKRDATLLSSRKGRTLVEYYWTATPTIILRILENNPEIDFLTYLDADLYFFSSTDAIFQEVGSSSVFIHGHNYSPELKHLEESCGKFNVGLLGFRRDSNAFKVLRWWREKCIEWCFLKFEKDRMGDQKYLDSWPDLFSGVKISKHPGIGLAPWNYGQYQYDTNSLKQLTVDRNPVVFFHYSAFAVVNNNIFIPLVHKHYPLNSYLLREIYLPYCKTLRDMVARVIAVLPSFQFGMDNTISLDEHGFIFYQGDNQEQPEFSSFNVNKLDHQWGYYLAQQTEKVGKIETSDWVLKPEHSLEDFLENKEIASAVETTFFVGCHLFQEQEWFNKTFVNLKKLFLFEPVPKIVEMLRQKVAGDKRAQIFPFAVSDETGRTIFNIANNFQSSSLLPLAEHKKIFPSVDYSDEIQVQQITLNQFIQEHENIIPDLLYIDVQGAEYKVLSGLSSEQLSKVKIIYTEVSLVEMYQGGRLLDDIKELLSEEFEFIGFRDMLNTQVHGDALFVNKRFLAQLSSSQPVCDQGVNQKLDEFENEISEIIELYQSGQKRTAILALNGLLKENVNHPELMNLKAEFQYGVGQDYLNDSLKTWEALVKENPDDVLFLNNLGVAAWESNRRSLGVAATSRVLTLDPENTAAITNINEITSTIAFEADQLPELFSNIYQHNIIPNTNHQCLNDEKIGITNNINQLDPLVSVIVSTYASEAFMRECLDDLVNQTIFSQIEIIIVDANSPENEKTIIGPYQQKFPNIKYIRTRERIGIYAAWNIAIKAASGEFIMPMSTNDRLSKNACENLLKALQESPEVMLVYGDSYMTEIPHQTFDNHTLSGMMKWPEYSFEELKENCLVGPNPMWRRAVHDTVGYFDEQFLAIGDQDFWIRIGEQFDLKHIPLVTGLFWNTTDSLSGNTSRATEEIIQIRRKYNNRYRLPVLQTNAESSDDLLAQALAIYKTTGISLPTIARQILANHKLLSEQQKQHFIGTVANFIIEQIDKSECYISHSPHGNLDEMLSMMREYYDINKTDNEFLETIWFVEQYKSNRQYKNWVNAHDLLEIDGQIFAERMALSWKVQPVIHFIMFLYPQEQALLADTIDSLAAQLYQGWRLTIIADGPEPDPIFSEQEQLNWIRFSGDASPYDVLNQAIKNIDSDWVCLIEAGVRLPYHAMSLFGDYINLKPDWKLIYTDEDEIETDGKRLNPKFKPDFNLDLLRSTPYVGNFGLVEKKCLLELGGYESVPNAEFYDVVFRAYDQYGEQAIGHLAEVLFHKSTYSKQEFQENDLQNSIYRHLQRNSINATVSPGYFVNSFRIDYHHQSQPKVSIIIPTKDKLEFLAPCVESVLNKTDYLNYEVIIVDNQSSDPDVFQFYSELKEKYNNQIKILEYPHAFNFSAICNFAADQASGDYLLLLNNDTEVLHKEWLDRMIMHAMREDVGVVGARLVYPETGLLQHAGIIMGLHDFADHPYNGIINLKEPGYLGRAQLVQNFSAVTGACQLISKKIYQSVGGMDEEQFAVSFNDVDLCLKIKEAGFRNVWTPYSTLIHYGSISQNSTPSSKETAERFMAEQQAVFKKWRNFIAKDPAYNHHLSLVKPDFSVVLSMPSNWDVNFHDRLRVLGVPLDGGAGDYRVIQPFNALRNRGLAQCEYVRLSGTEKRVFSLSEIARLKPDVLVMHSVLSDPQLKLLQQCKQLLPEIFIVYMIDDLVNQIPEKSAAYKTMKRNFRDAKSRVRKALSFCDRAIVSTKPLAKFCQEMISDVIIVPNSLENSAWLELESKRRQSEKLRVGWAGALQHQGDLEIIIDVVKKTSDDVDWVFMGMCPDEIRPYIKEFHEPVKISDYPKVLASLNLDLAIAPLEDNRFNEAKSNLRLLEYGILGWPVICSNVFPYREAPVTCVENSSEAWVSAIRQAIDNLDNLAVEGDILKEWVKQNYMLENNLQLWLDALSPKHDRQEDRHKIAGKAAIN